NLLQRRPPRRKRGRRVRQRRNRARPQNQERGRARRKRRRAASDGMEPKKKAPARPPEDDVLKFPVRRSWDDLTRADFAKVMSDGGVEFSDRLLQFLHVPPRMVRGVSERVEF